MGANQESYRTRVATRIYDDDRTEHWHCEVTVDEMAAVWHEAFIAEAALEPDVAGRLADRFDDSMLHLGFRNEAEKQELAESVLAILESLGLTVVPKG